MFELKAGIENLLQPSKLIVVLYIINFFNRFCRCLFGKKRSHCHIGVDNGAVCRACGRYHSLLFLFAKHCKAEGFLFDGK